MPVVPMREADKVRSLVRDQALYLQPTTHTRFISMQACNLFNRLSGIDTNQSYRPIPGESRN